MLIDPWASAETKVAANGNTCLQFCQQVFGHSETAAIASKLHRYLVPTPPLIIAIRTKTAQSFVMREMSFYADLAIPLVFYQFCYPDAMVAT
jgi:hypothetical protein